MIKNPSPEQNIFFDWVVNGTGSCVLKAVAGAGKTSTIVHGTTLMKGDIFLGAYNKDIATEIKSKLGNSAVNVSTMHAAGLRAFRRVADPKVSADKCRDIFREMTHRDMMAGVLEGPVLELVSYAKQAAVGVGNSEKDKSVWMDLVTHFDVETFNKRRDEDCTEEILSLALAVFNRSAQACKHIIDFDDMIFAPLYFGVKFHKYDWVLLDEAQDTNRSRRLLALELMKPTSRLVAVGDPHQAIYGFTGADADSLDQIQAATNATVLALSVTFRCPKAIVNYAHTWVNHIHAAETAPEGVLTHADIEQLTEVAKVGDTVLCRFNAPLIKYVYQFVAKGIPARIQGREISAGLKNTVRRWKSKNLQDLLEKVKNFTEKEVKKYEQKEQGARAGVVQDRGDCIVVIIERVMQVDPKCKNPVERVVQEIDSIFGAEDDKKPHVQFSSIHRAKGREWKRVIWLQTPPSAWAKQQWELEQEMNLNYVGATRAMLELILMQVPAK